ncbi:MAG: hypothetical protein CBD95_002525 [Flavobacteriales bacterium TMED235]|mgnify:FL=1|nr:MAG: hypothetical protein CBD95_002525 [Flavobacteriales bacterium TMED235]
MNKIVMFFLIYSFSFVFVYASNENVKNRQNAMQQVRESVKVLFPIAKGKNDYDDFVVISMLEQMLDAAKPYASYFPIEKEVLAHSEAAETIWSDRTGFNNSVKKFLDDIEYALNAEPESLDDFKPMFAKITTNCQSCHQVYRLK